MNCVLAVKVTPRSSRNQIKLEDGIVRAWVMAAPTDGEANKAVCELLAKQLGLPKTSVNVTRGETSRHKQLAVSGIQLEDALERLK